MKRCIVIPMLLFFFYAFGQSNYMIERTLYDDNDDKTDG
jgi:hypothetical protein